MESIARDKQKDHIIVALTILAKKGKSGNYVTASQVQEIIVETIYGRKLYSQRYSMALDQFSIRKELNRVERRAVKLYFNRLVELNIIKLTQNPMIVKVNCDSKTK